jgi:hypothetical protein
VDQVRILPKTNIKKKIPVLSTIWVRRWLN